MEEILQNGDPHLRKVAEPLPENLFGTKEPAGIVAKLAEVLDPQEDGVAIAANQIGLPWRIFIVRYDRVKEPTAEGEPPHPVEIGVYINPEFVRRARKREEMEEGCLSVRG